MAFTDNFNRANGGLGANWTTDSIFSALTIVSNACTGSTGGAQNVATYTGGGTIAADQYAQVKVVTPGGFIGLVLRSNNAGTYYACFYSAGSATMYRVTGGSFANITVGSTITPAANDIIYFEIVGSALTMKVNGVSVATATDGTFTSGYPGIDIFDNLGVIDDFEGGAAGVVAVTVNLTGVSASPAIGVLGFNGSLPLDSVAATPAIGTGTVTIGSVVVTPPDQGLVAGGGHWYGVPEDEKVYLTGVAASPEVGKVTAIARGALDELERMFPFPKPPEMPPGMRGLFKPVEKPIPPAVFVYPAPFPKLKAAVGTGKVNAFYEEIDEETIMLALLSHE